MFAFSLEINRDKINVAIYRVIKYALAGLIIFSPFSKKAVDDIDVLFNKGKQIYVGLLNENFEEGYLIF